MEAEGEAEGEADGEAEEREDLSLISAGRPAGEEVGIQFISQEYQQEESLLGVT